MVFIEGETKGLFRCEAGLYSPSHGSAEVHLAHNVAAYDLVAMRNYEPVFSLSVDQHEEMWNVQTRWLARTMRLFPLLGTVKLREKIALDVRQIALNLGMKKWNIQLSVEWSAKKAGWRTWSRKLSEEQQRILNSFYPDNHNLYMQYVFDGELAPSALGIVKSPFNIAHVTAVIFSQGQKP